MGGKLKKKKNTTFNWKSSYERAHFPLPLPPPPPPPPIHRFMTTLIPAFLGHIFQVFFFSFDILISLL